jgi:hypothetical protein
MIKSGLGTVLLVGTRRARAAYHGATTIRLCQHYTYMGWYYKRRMTTI